MATQTFGNQNQYTYNVDNKGLPFGNPITSSSIPTIKANTIGNTSPMNLPAAPTLPNATSTLVGASASNVSSNVSHNGDGTLTYNTSTPPQGWDAQTYANFKAANPNLEPSAQDTANMQGTNNTSTDTSNQQGLMDKLQQMLGIVPKPQQGAEAKLQSSDAQMQFDAAQKEVQNYTSQINSIVKGAQEQQMQNEKTAGNRGLTTDLLDRQNAQISRNAAIQALPLQALLASAQGNQAVAQQHLDSTYKLYAEDAQAQKDYQDKVFSVVTNYLDKSEQRQYDELKTKNDQNYKQLTDALNYSQTIGSEARKNGDMSTAAKLAQLKPPTDPSSPNFASDLASYNQQVANVVSTMKPDALRAAQIASAWSTVAKNNATNNETNDPATVIAYAQQYASTGMIPTGLPKGTFGVVAQVAKEMPKAPGTLVDVNTGIKPSAVKSGTVDGISALYDLSKKINDAKTLYNKNGVINRAEYNTMRSEIVDLLARARTGAAISATEEATYKSKIPNITWSIKPFGDIKLDGLKSSLDGKLNTVLQTNGTSIYGYSKVKLSNGKEYTVGDTITNSEGQQGRVNPDGSITLLQ